MIRIIMKARFNIIKHLLFVFIRYVNIDTFNDKHINICNIIIQIYNNTTKTTTSKLYTCV